MSHRSENARRLAIESASLTRLEDFPAPNRRTPEVWLVELPFGRTLADAEQSPDWHQALAHFADGLHPESVVALLTSAEDAAETLPRLGSMLQFQLWVAVKLYQPIPQPHGQLPRRHAALLVLSKYRHALSHTKTRIGYTYCPVCDRTTKDYGGKKHTYHEYGTLMSDVWRDISFDPEGEPTEIVDRLADLFGLDPYRTLKHISLTSITALRPRQTEPAMSLPQSAEGKVRGQSRLIVGDCLAELAALPEASVDFAFADPPYNLDKRYDAWDDALDVRDYLAWCDRWLDGLARVLKPGRTCAVLNIPLLAVRHFQHMKQSLHFQSWIAWEGLGLPVRMIMPAHYAIACFSKGEPRPLPGLAGGLPVDDERALLSLKEEMCLRQACVAHRRATRLADREPITDLWWDIHRLKHNSRRVDHPCQLPPALMHRLIALFTRRGEVVLDPFNGAGTTTLCAEQLGRRYIGIELSRSYHDIAVARHKLLQQGGDPFAKARRIPKAKNSRVARAGRVRYAVPKKELQLDVKRVAAVLGHLPSRDEMEKHGKYPIRYYDEYFVSWGEVCAAARTTGMTETRTPLPRDGGRQLELFDTDATE